MASNLGTRVSRWLFGRTEIKELGPDFVDGVVDGSPSTDLLMDFGRSLLRANDERITAIDAKATTIVGYSTAILAFLVTRGGSLVGEPPWRTFPMLVAALCGVLACAFAGLTLRAARDWQDMGEATWFPDDGQTAGDTERLRRWYLKAMHQSYQDNHRITDKKAGELIKAQLAVAVAGACLGFTLALDGLAAILSRL